MKKPYSKLPFKAYSGKIGAYLIDANDNIVANKIEMVPDAEYLCWSANNMKEAIELLKLVHYFTTSIQDEDLDRELIDELYALNIDKFLNKLDEL